MQLRLKTLLVSLFMGLAASTLVFAQEKGEIISIPGFGDVGITKNGKTYTVALADWGTWDFTGTYKNKTDFDLATNIPAGSFTDYIPGVGQMLGLLGLDTVGIRISPKGMGMAINLEGGGLGALRGSVTEALSEIPGAGRVIDTMISVLEVKRFSLEGSIIKKVFQGKVEGSISLAGADFTFQDEGAISWKTIKASIVKAGKKVVNDYIVKYTKLAFNKSKDAVIKYGAKSLDAVGKAWDSAARFARESAKTINYATNSYDTNLKKDLPKYINAKGDPMVKESLKALDELYQEILPTVRNLGSKAEKDELIGVAFGPLNKEFDKRWQKLKDDDSVKAWSTLSKREKELMKRWKEGIEGKWNLVRAKRGDLYNQLISARPMYRVPRSPEEGLRILSAYANARVPVLIESKMELVTWDVPMSNGGQNGTRVKFYATHGAPNQQWILVPAGAPNQYHFFHVATGRYLHMEGGPDKDAKSTNLVVWDGASAEYRQTVFTAFATADGYVHFKTDKGFALDLAGGVPTDGSDLQLWNNTKGDPQAFYVYPAPVKD